MLRKTIRLTALTAAAILITSCAPHAVPDTRAADETAIRSLDEQWSATAAKNDLEGTLAFYAEDARAASAQHADRQRPEVDS